MSLGSRRANGDSWIALGVILANIVFLHDLLASKPEGAYIKTNTLPIALSATLIVLSLVLLWGSFRQPTGQSAGALKDAGISPLLRVSSVIVLTIVYISALPWFGYMLSSSLYFGALSLVFGNRKPVPIIVAMVTVPLVLMFFFEKYMIVLLPSARLFN